MTDPPIYGHEVINIINIKMLYHHRLNHPLKPYAKSLFREILKYNDWNLLESSLKLEKRTTGEISATINIKKKIEDKISEISNLASVDLNEKAVF